MGKSGAVGRKLAGTFSSTGTPAVFLHTAEGVHGDLGVLTQQDVLMVLTYSGETDELVRIVPVVKRIGASMIAVVGPQTSQIARYADVSLDITVAQEACPLGLAPTASTTAMIALGDALAITVMECRQFTREDYALFHPAGSLGRRLLLRVEDVMRVGDEMVIVTGDTSVQDTLFAITKAHAGAACVVDANGKLTGIITDGDIRRSAISSPEFLKLRAEQIMVSGPKTIGADKLAAEALRILQGPPQIGDLPVVEDGKPVGVLMLKDLATTGII
jgi:arabinose-5-phosphate isomerase